MIEIQGLCKRFGSAVAVNHLSLQIDRGDAFGFIGPNGAGKTTTIRMLATLLRPDAGTATINGCDIRTDPDAPWTERLTTLARRLRAVLEGHPAKAVGAQLRAGG